MTRKRDVT